MTDISRSDQLKKMKTGWENYYRILHDKRTLFDESEIAILVDCQGLFFGVQELLNNENDSKILGHATSYLFSMLEQSIWSKHKSRKKKGYILEDELLNLCQSCSVEQLLLELQETKGIYRPRFEYNFFYAPFPKDEISKFMWISPNKDARSIELINDNRIILYGNPRDYGPYEGFISEIASASINHEIIKGKYKFYVQPGTGKLDRLDEKQVDSKMIIKAMDLLYETRTSDICVVSSDTDFLPLKDRFEGEHCGFSQVDLAKFNKRKNVAKEIRESFEIHNEVLDSIFVSEMFRTLVDFCPMSSKKRHEYEDLMWEWNARDSDEVHGRNR